MNLKEGEIYMEKENLIKSNIITQESEIKKNSIRILKGISFAIVISLILLLIFALLLTYTSISESTITPVVVAVAGVSILIGSSIATSKIRKNGLLNGGIVGFIYGIILYVSSSLCLVGFTFTLHSIIMLMVGIATGMLGGVIGVNLNRKVGKL